MTPATAGGASTATNYELTGSPVSTYAGQRVEIVGTFEPSATSSMSGTRAFRVLSVRPLGGTCPQ